ncbi:MAG: hypothetical protein KY466_08480 [Gemmatimonadetes bacterium]|nr:hypothetical protein [Gemmatimonadota bacterium]
MDETQAREGHHPVEPGAAAGGPDPRGRPRKSRAMWWLLAVVLAFLAGFGWQYFRAMQIESRLERTEQELAVERLRVGLAQAAVAAQSGDFEAARRQMSTFFTSLQAQLGELPPDLRETGEDMLLSRDEVITELSRSNPRSGDDLYDMLVRLRLSLGEAPPPLAPATTDTAGAVP